MQNKIYHLCLLHLKNNNNTSNFNKIIISKYNKIVIIIIKNKIIIKINKVLINKT